jgi:hypothetical protein
MLYNERRKKESKAVLPHNVIQSAHNCKPTIHFDKGVAGNHRRGRGREAISISYHMMQ